MCAQVIRCLQDHIDEEAFSSECKEEVTRDQIRSNQDYRCASAVFSDILHACLHACGTAALLQDTACDWGGAAM